MSESACTEAVFQGRLRACSKACTLSVWWSLHWQGVAGGRASLRWGEAALGAEAGEGAAAGLDGLAGRWLTRARAAGPRLGPLWKKGGRGPGGGPSRGPWWWPRLGGGGPLCGPLSGLLWNLCGGRGDLSGRGCCFACCSACSATFFCCCRRICSGTRLPGDSVPCGEKTARGIDEFLLSRT